MTALYRNHKFGRHKSGGYKYGKYNNYWIFGKDSKNC